MYFDCVHLPSPSRDALRDTGAFVKTTARNNVTIRDCNAVPRGSLDGPGFVFLENCMIEGGDPAGLDYGEPDVRLMTRNCYKVIKVGKDWIREPIPDYGFLPDPPEIPVLPEIPPAFDLQKSLQEEYELKIDLVPREPAQP